MNPCILLGRHHCRTRVWFHESLLLYCVHVGLFDRLYYSKGKPIIIILVIITYKTTSIAHKSLKTKLRSVAKQELITLRISKQYSSCHQMTDMMDR